MLNTHLKYPPINKLRLKKIPDVLISHQYFNYYDAPISRFILSPTKKSEFGRLVIMDCIDTKINRDGIRDVPCLYIWKLISNCSGHGYGSKMLDFARSYSKKIGCNGYISLTSDGCYNPHRLPHIFYRKYGMSTESRKIDKKLDKFIAKGKNATYKDFKTEEMFYPPIKHPKSKIKKLIDKFFKIF